jgi:hypothetical protein
MHPERPVILPTDQPVYILCSDWAMDDKVHLYGVFSWDDLLQEIHKTDVFETEGLKRVLEQLREEDDRTHHFRGNERGDIFYHVRRVPASPNNPDLHITAVRNPGAAVGDVTIHIAK